MNKIKMIKGIELSTLNTAYHNCGTSILGECGKAAMWTLMVLEGTMAGMSRKVLSFPIGANTDLSKFNGIEDFFDSVVDEFPHHLVMLISGHRTAMLYSKDVGTSRTRYDATRIPMSPTEHAMANNFDNLLAVDVPV